MSKNRRVAIVSPYFPPSNLAGVHRARLLAKHLPACSWDPIVVCVNERCYEQAPDHQLSRLVPDSVRVIKSEAISSRLTRLVGIGDIGIRAFWHLEKIISSLLSTGEVDLLFITTSPYYNALAGPGLKQRFGIPLVVDFQDPWISKWGKTLSAFSKGGISHRLATWLEPRVVRHADHLTTVSAIASEELRTRYPVLPPDALSAVPIGGDIDDFEFLKSHPIPLNGLESREGEYHFSYVGTMWPRAVSTMRSILMALAEIKDDYPAVYAKLRVNFVGTSAQPDNSKNYHVLSHAEEIGVSDIVTEIPQRVGYMKALSVLANTNAILVIGSDEAHYTASKLPPSLLAGRPVLAVLHEESSACSMLRRVGGGEVVPFSAGEQPSVLARRVCDAMLKFIRCSQEIPRVDSTKLSSLSAAFMAREYAKLFDDVVTKGCRSPWW